MLKNRKDEKVYLSPAILPRVFAIGHIDLYLKYYKENNCVEKVRVITRSREILEIRLYFVTHCVVINSNQRKTYFGPKNVQNKKRPYLDLFNMK